MRSRDQYDSVVRTRNPTGVGTMNLITKPFFPQKPSGREQLVGRFDDLAPGRLLLAPHSHAITVAARGKRYGASTLSCPRKQLHHSCLSRRRHIVHINLHRRSLLTDPLTEIPSPTQRGYESRGIDSIRPRNVQTLKWDVPSTSASKKDAQTRR